MTTLPSSSKLQSLTLNNSNSFLLFSITGFIITLCFTISFILFKKTDPKKESTTQKKKNPENEIQSWDEDTCQDDKLETILLNVDDDSEDGMDCCEDGNLKVKKKRKKKKRAKKKKKGDDDGEEKKDDGRSLKEKELVCLYPFTSSGSATQRKIKQQYDHLMRCNSSKGLTLAQVGQFANCLVEARNELQHKSEIIQRKFPITKALLLKADRSSFDRFRQQIYKLEVEQKRLEEDALVYNWLQEQLKLSPAYKKMLEISESMELKAKSKELAVSSDAEFSDISFEEFLAQEKKDSFWQKNGKAKWS